MHKTTHKYIPTKPHIRTCTHVIREAEAEAKRFEKEARRAQRVRVSVKVCAEWNVCACARVRACMHGCRDVFTPYISLWSLLLFNFTCNTPRSSYS
jgi:hypothetical protein